MKAISNKPGFCYSFCLDPCLDPDPGLEIFEDADPDPDDVKYLLSRSGSRALFFSENYR